MDNDNAEPKSESANCGPTVIVRCSHCDATLRVTASPGEKYCNDCGKNFVMILMTGKQIHDIRSAAGAVVMAASLLEGGGRGHYPEMITRNANKILEVLNGC